MTPGHAARKWTSIKKAGGAGQLYLLDWIDPRGQSHREILPFLEAVERRKIIAAELARAWNQLGLNRRGNQSYSRTEMNKIRYDQAKEKRLCPRCQKNEVESNTQCPACLEYLRQYQRRLYYARKAEKMRLKALEEGKKTTPTPKRKPAPKKEPTDSNNAKRRGPGRPPKAAIAAPTRKPGRPKKIVTTATAIATPTPRKRGRPRKNG